jgi:hypothetical protein
MSRGTLSLKTVLKSLFVRCLLGHHRAMTMLMVQAVYSLSISRTLSRELTCAMCAGRSDDQNINERDRTAHERLTSSSLALSVH